jgi:hypothetical protein
MRATIYERQPGAWEIARDIWNSKQSIIHREVIYAISC